MRVQRQLKPFAGFVVLEEYDITDKNKSGFNVHKEDAENAPQIGKILTIGTIPVEVTGKFIEWELTLNEREIYKKIYCPYEVGMIVAYQKYGDYPIRLGIKEYKAVPFEKLLFEIKETETT